MQISIHRQANVRTEVNRPGFPGARISWKGKGYGEAAPTGSGAAPTGIVRLRYLVTEIYLAVY